MRLYQRKEDGPWWFEFRLKGKHYRRSTGESKITKARRVAEDFRSARRRGEPEERPEEPQRAAIRAALAEYVNELARRGRTDKYIKDSASAIESIVAHAAISYLDELDTPAIERGLGAFAGCSTGRQNRALQYLGSFTRWMYRTGRIPTNPAEFVSKVRHVAAQGERRALTPEELEALTTCPDVHVSRRLVYLVAAYTGLRRSELDSLKADLTNLDLAQVTVQAVHAKNRKAATLPLAPVVIEAWRSWLSNPLVSRGASEVRSSRALPVSPNKGTFYEDLARARVLERGPETSKRHPLGVPIHDDGQQRLDFHALRVTFVTNLARSGVGLSLAQDLARHSTPELTANIYTRLDGLDRREAIGQLGDFLEKARRAQKRAHKSRDSA